VARLNQGAIKIGSAARESASAGAGFWPGNGWWVFCVLVFVIKLFLLLLDPRPKFFLGDSGSYILTALTGWIPADRSYFYGYVVRYLAVWPGSFTPLLLGQALASGVTTILFAIICSRFFELTNKLCFLFGFLCALDPCQLVWERYVMTETFSLLVYVLVLYWSLLYLRDRRIWQLGVVQALSVVLIGFRMSYLPLVQACTILLPVIAFGRFALPRFCKCSEARVSGASVLGTGFVHVVASTAIMLATHGVYKQVNGWLSHREPDYLYTTGLHLVSVWAPALRPDDATDPRFRALIADGRKFGMQDLRQRLAQHFIKGFLIDRWSKIEKDFKKNERVARQTAMNALRRHPLQIAGLAVKTYMEYWDIAFIKKYTADDLGRNELTDDQVKTLAEKFHFITARGMVSQPFSLLRWYSLRAWPYYFIVIVSPLICLFAACIGHHRAFALLLFVHTSILMVVVTALSPQPPIRYLQPVSFLTLLGIAICVDRVLRRGTLTPARPASEVCARDDSDTRPHGIRNPLLSIHLSYWVN
jgi:hypothetical protein